MRPIPPRILSGAFGVCWDARIGGNLEVCLGSIYAAAHRSSAGRDSAGLLTSTWLRSSASYSYTTWQAPTHSPCRAAASSRCQTELV